jgi:hypothetical protein
MQPGRPLTAFQRIKQPFSSQPKGRGRLGNLFMEKRRGRVGKEEIGSLTG